MSMFATPGLGNYVNKKTGIFDKIGSFLTGDKDKFTQLSTQTPEQQKFLSNLFSQLQGGSIGQNYNASQNYLGDLISGTSGAYDKFSAPYRNEFEQQTIPRLAERFAGLGGGLGGGSLGSSGFGQAIGGAGAQFQSSLANLYAQLQQQAANQALGQYGSFSSLGLGTRPFENVYQPGSTGLLGGFASGTAQGLGQAGGSAMMSQLLPLLAGLL